MNNSMCGPGWMHRVALIAATLVIGSTAGRAQTLINGAGATFPAPIYEKWFSDYRSVDKSVQVNYQPIGSGGGIRQITEGTVDFGASDMPLTDALLEQYKDKHKFDVLMFPTVLGADVPTYNIPGVSADLSFTPEALAGIYLGKITKWNDPAIQKANPKVKLPNLDIVVVHRSEGSGTTFCWTDYLSKISPEWEKQVGRNASVKWPVGLGAKGNEGVTGQIKQTSGAIGYVELIYALSQHIPYGSVKNADGVFVKADINSVSAAAAGVVKDMPDNFRVSITNAPGKNSYPISTFTWLLVPSQISDSQKRDAIKKFLKWALTTGQSSAPALAYAPLPKPVQSKELAAIAKIK